MKWGGCYIHDEMWRVLYSRWNVEGVIFTMKCGGCYIHDEMWRVLYSRWNGEGVIFTMKCGGCYIHDEMGRVLQSQTVFTLHLSLKVKLNLPESKQIHCHHHCLLIFSPWYFSIIHVTCIYGYPSNSVKHCSQDKNFTSLICSPQQTRNTYLSYPTHSLA